MLASLVGHLQRCSPAAFAETIDAAASHYSSPAVWTRLLGVGTHRVGEVADLLWPFASNVVILGHDDIVRDAVRFLAAAYPSRTLDERITFEVEALRPDLFSDEPERRWWRSTLSRFLSLVDVGALASDAMRALREELAAANELAGNPPTRSMSVRWSSAARSVTHSLLADEGVDVDAGVDAQMLAQSEALYEMVGATPSPSDAAALRALWGAARATIDFYDANARALHEKVEQPVWGHISNAVERIARAKAYVPGTDGMPTIIELLGVLRRLWASRFPVPKDKANSSLSWSNWEVRVYAAQAYVALTNRFGEAHGEIIDVFDAILADPTPQVRLQAAQNLQVLSRIALDKMWALAERVARDETHTHVLSSFLNHVLPRFTRQDVAKVKQIIEIVRARRDVVERDNKPERDQVAEQLGGLTAQLWAWQKEAGALG